MPIFAMEKLSKSFGGLKAIVDLSFGIEEKTINSLIGPNGAGKTTAFSLITGFLKPDAGQVIFRGKEITGLPPYQIVNMGIVRTFQDVRVLNKLTVKENILVGLRDTHQHGLIEAALKGKNLQREMAKKIEKLIEFVGLEGAADELAENISYAEQKLMILARALATDANLLLLDEPASGLDQKSITRMMDLLRRLVEEGKTVLIVEHNMDVVIHISDYVVVLDFGQKIAAGTPGEIRCDQRVIQAYLGVC
jgi:branched-chain amino acid transport system ATP-binding protein